MEGSIAEVEEDAGAEASPSTSISLTRSTYLAQVRVRSVKSLPSVHCTFTGSTVTPCLAIDSGHEHHVAHKLNRDHSIELMGFSDACMQR
jgi:hypothetical protein